MAEADLRFATKRNAFCHKTEDVLPQNAKLLFHQIVFSIFVVVCFVENPADASQLYSDVIYETLP